VPRFGAAAFGITNNDAPRFEHTKAANAGREAGDNSRSVKQAALVDLQGRGIRASPHPRAPGESSHSTGMACFADNEIT
jgi:hypothetical protein